MAPRSTRPNSRSNAPVTRKRGESDPNEPPKKRKTRHSKGGSDDDRKVEDDGEDERNVGKSARRTKKGRYVDFLDLFCSSPFLSVLFPFLFY
jgi:hypothetical protein